MSALDEKMTAEMQAAVGSLFQIVREMQDEKNMTPQAMLLVLIGLTAMWAAEVKRDLDDAI